MSAGFIKLIRGPDLDDLLLDPPAFTLLAQVALRARRSDGYNVRRLEVGEALIGDHRKIGLTRREYRTRLDRLVNAGFLTIKTTNKGTVARLTNAKVFDINADENGQQNGQRAASKRPTDGQQAATNKNEKKDKNERMEEKREEPLSLKEAVALFEPLFPDRPVKLSLSDLIEKKGRGYLTEKYCHKWLTAEERRKAPKKEPSFATDHVNPDPNSEPYNEEEARREAMEEAIAFKIRTGQKLNEAERDFKNTGLVPVCY